MKDLPFYLIIFGLSLTSLYLFASGFFLTSVPLSQSSQCNDTQFTNTLYASTYDLKCWSQPLFKRAVYLFIDALRYDFAYSTPDEIPYHGKMKHMRTMGEPIHTKRYHYTAHYPTTTAQRLKGLTCGIVPSFVEAADTFNSPVIVEDSYVKQYHENGVKFNVVGNILWKNSFTTLLNDIKTGPSLDVTDRDSIDFQCARELKNQMKEGVNDVVLFHTLGLDHNGHYHRKIRHEEMYKKLEWQDEFIYNASKLVGDDTLFIVGGDHGLTEDGNHGGSSIEETDAALLIYSPHGLSEMMKGVNEIMQVDLVPTMSLIMGVPVPFGNIGAPIRPIFLGNSPQLKDYHHFVNALNVTGMQIIRYLQAYSKVNHRTISWLPDIQERLKYVVNEEVINFGDVNKLKNLVDIHEQILHEIEKIFVEENATYKKPLMIYSLLIISIVLAICILYILDIQYIKTSHEFHIVIVLSIASTCILLLFEIVSDIIQATLCSCALFIALQICFGFLPNFFNAFKSLEIEQMISFFLIIVYCIWIAVQENSDSFYEEELSEGYAVMQFSFALICLFLYKNRPTKQIQDIPNGIEIELNDLEESSSNTDDSIVTNTTPSKKANSSLFHFLLHCCDTYFHVSKKFKTLMQITFIFMVMISTSLLMNHLKHPLDVSTIYMIIAVHFIFTISTSTNYYSILVHICQVCVLIYHHNNPGSYYPLLMYLLPFLCLKDMKKLHTSLLYICAMLLPQSKTPFVLMIDFILSSLLHVNSLLTPVLLMAMSYWMYNVTDHGFTFDKIHFDAGFVGINSFNLILNGIIIVFDTFIFPFIASFQAYLTNGKKGLFTVTAIQTAKVVGVTVFLVTQTGHLFVRRKWTPRAVFDWIGLAVLDVFVLIILLTSHFKDKIEEKNKL